MLQVYMKILFLLCLLVTWSDAFLPRSSMGSTWTVRHLPVLQGDCSCCSEDHDHGQNHNHHHHHDHHDHDGLDKISAADKDRSDRIIHEFVSKGGHIGDVKMDLTNDDMVKMGALLTNITESLTTQPEMAFTVASQELDWLFTRNLPGLTQMLLQEYPILRQDTAMMNSYLFLLDFMEALAKETSTLLKKNQDTLRSLLETLKEGERYLDKFLKNDQNDNVLSPEFMVFLQSELDNLELNSPMESLLHTLKLRILEEIGEKEMGSDVTIIPKLASITDIVELRSETKKHLSTFNSIGAKELFLQALMMMRQEISKSYQNVDDILLFNLKEIQKIVEETIKEEAKQESAAAGKGFSKK